MDGEKDSNFVALNSRAPWYGMGTGIWDTIQSNTSETDAKYSNHSLTTEIPLSMEAAILDGISRSPWEIGQQTLIQCSSSNCTWNPFATIGICHRCNDLTPDPKRVDGFWDVLVAATNNCYFEDLNFTTTAFTVPNGHFIANVDVCPPYNGDFSHCEGSPSTGSYKDRGYALTSSGTGNPNKTVSMKDIDTLLWSMSFITPDIEALNI